MRCIDTSTRGTRRSGRSRAGYTSGPLAGRTIATVVRSGRPLRTSSPPQFPWREFRVRILRVIPATGSSTSGIQPDRCGLGHSQRVRRLCRASTSLTFDKLDCRTDGALRGLFGLRQHEQLSTHRSLRICAGVCIARHAQQRLSTRPASRSWVTSPRGYTSTFSNNGHERVRAWTHATVPLERPARRRASAPSRSSRKKSTTISLGARAASDEHQLSRPSMPISWTLDDVITITDTLQGATGHIRVQRGSGLNGYTAGVTYYLNAWDTTYARRRSSSGANSSTSTPASSI